MRTKTGYPQKESVTFRLDSESMKKLRELAAAEHRTVSSIINQAAQEYLDRREGKSSTPRPVSTPTTALKMIRQGQRLTELEQTAKNLLAAIQAMRDEDAT